MTLLLALPLAAADAKPVKKKKKKIDPYEGSKYKSFKVLTPEESHTYRYDENGNPIVTGAKKKPKKKKNSSDEEEAKPDCAEGESCGAAPKAD